MDMPPSRYRVVEQGRRLVVIDTLVGEPVRPVTSPLPEMPGGERRRRPPRAAPRAAARSEPRGRYAGGAATGFTTARWFDNEGPRRIRLNQDGQTQLGMVALILFVVGAFFVTVIGWPVLLVIGFLALNAKARGGFRTAATTWLTALDANEG